MTDKGNDEPLRGQDFRAITHGMNAEEGRDFLERLLNNIPDLIFIKDAEFRHLTGNKAFFDHVSHRCEADIIGAAGKEGFASEEVEVFLAADRVAFECGQSTIIENITSGSGETRFFETTKIRFEDANGTPFLLGVARDISERKEIEDELISALNFQNLMLDHIPDAVFVKDRHFKIVQANENFLKVYPEDQRESVIGSTTIEQYDVVEREAFLSHDKIALGEGYSETEESIQFPNGERQLWFTKKIRFEDKNGDPFVLGIGRDITQFKKAQQDTELSIDLLNTVFDTVTGAIVALDSNKRILMINNAGYELLLGQVVATPVDWPTDIQFLDPADMRPLEASHDPVERAVVGQRIGGEVHLMTWGASSESRYFRVSSASVGIPESPLKTVIVFDDVSEAERNRQHLERQSRLDALGQLTGGIAHDFNNLLNTMQYALELIRREDLSERGKRSIGAALKSIGRGSELTSRLLAFAKRQPSRATAHHIDDIFGEMRELVAPAIEASITVSFIPPHEEMLVYCDQGQLQNAILNLILNSRDAMLQHNKGNQIRIEARSVDGLPADRPSDPHRASSQAVAIPQGIRRPKESQQNSDGKAPSQNEDTSHKVQCFVEISVSDNGPGMSPAVAARALDPFFTTKGVNSGTGLGLSMVYGFVQQAGGDLRIYTEEDDGTAIKLYLPRGSSESGLEDTKTLEPLVDGHGETILVVEDEVHLLEQLSELLKELNYNIVEAPHGRAALEMLENGLRPDLILTDVVMTKGIGGFELARRARLLIENVPIIYMSGYTGFSDEQMGDVIAPLLPKPSSPNTTAQMIRSILDEAQEA